MKKTNFKLILTAFLSFAVLSLANGQKQVIKERIDPLIETVELKMIKGTVTAFNNFNVMNAEVTAKKTKSLTFTDSIGKFEILVPDGDILLIKAKGFQNTRREVSANEGNININMILMKGKRNQGKAVAFGHLYGHELAYASEYYCNEKHDVQMYSDLRGLIQSKLPVNTVTDRGRIRVYIRGRDINPFRSSENNGAAMFVLDGMFISDIDFLNPRDIKSIRLLKGSEATMRYGSRCVNGIVLINTR